MKKYLDNLWKHEEIFWHQRSRIKWLGHMDRNSKFFHLTTLNRCRHNKIVQLNNPDGGWVRLEGEIQSVMHDFYFKLFTTERISDWSSVIECIPNQITCDMNFELTRKVLEKEVRTIVFQMGGSRAPGSDGFPGLLYHQLREVVGPPSVLTAVKSFLNKGKLLEAINYTYISVIAKIANPTLIIEFRPLAFTILATRLFRKS